MANFAEVIRDIRDIAERFEINEGGLLYLARREAHDARLVDINDMTLADAQALLGALRTAYKLEAVCV